MYLPNQQFYLYILAFIQIIGLLLFVKGFFPYKTYLSGFSSHTDAPPWLEQTSSSSKVNDDILNSPIMEPEFDCLVFVVVDALRNDFIFQDKGFQFVNSLIGQGSAIAFTAKATPPTVTMPRIKALTTGTVPSFLDAILNIAESDTSSSLKHYDNWVYQFKNNGNKTIHFFGDDTWLRLFPGLFTKTDGTTSFYVSDTVEVDQNVTRHIQSEFSKQDWDAIILHYLGLDHVGHLGGPKSPLMYPKQREMDQAIEKIYNIIADQDVQRLKTDPNAKGTLIVLCGDHGMNDAGNHGGSSIGETSAAMVFMSPRFNTRPQIKHVTHHNDNREKNEFSNNIIQAPTLNLYDEYVFGYPIIDQVDLVPTLSLLFGLPIPKNSLGKVILDLYSGDRKAPSILRSSKAPTVLRALQLNAHQLNQLLGGQVCHETESRHMEYLLRPSQALAMDAANAYIDCINKAKSTLSNTASDYNLQYMIVGTGLMILCAFILTTWTIFTIKKQSIHSSWKPIIGFITISILGYIISVFASSFVEEEHFIWYYYVQTLLILLGFQSFYRMEKSTKEKSTLVLLCILQMIFVRISIFWKSIDFQQELYTSFSWHLMSITLLISVLLGIKVLTSIKQNNVVDVDQHAGYIRKLCKAAYLFTISFTSILVLAYKIRADHKGSSSSSSSVLYPSIYQSIVVMELVNRLDQVELGKLIYNYGVASFLLLTAIIYVSKRASLMNLGDDNECSRPYIRLLLYMATPFFILLSKSQHSFLFLMFILQFESLLNWKRKHGQVPHWVISYFMFCLVQYGFFVTEHTNSMASIDLSNAYIGIRGYNTFFVGILTFISNWSGSIWWCIAGWAILYDQSPLQLLQQEKGNLDQGINNNNNNNNNNINNNNDNDDNDDAWFIYSLMQTTIFGLVLASLSISVTILREHLFIWTVFSPKYLYQLAWTIGYCWITQFIIGTFVIKYWYAWSAPYILELDTTNEEIINDHHQENDEE
ncbi:unnamed protein product [Cunninghamella blakesleeana]